MNEKVFYKVLKNGKAMNSGKFDYTDYLPLGKKAGEWTPKIPFSKLVECKKGYHVTEYWNMWFEENAEVYEVEVKELKTPSETIGVCTKQVCSSIRFVKKLELSFDTNQNTGNRNTGNWNTGDQNTGDRNTGNWNTGHWNTGDQNTGDLNTGNRNTGDQNTGDQNTGHWNTGDQNTGNLNTGNLNTGNQNTGYWNTANRHCGSFNTIDPETVLLFNKSISLKEYSAINWPNWFYFNIEPNDPTLQKSWQKAFKNASKKEIKKTIELPNFDYIVFEKITGITKKEIQKKG